MEKSSPKDTTNHEILEAVQSGFQNMEERFCGLDTRLTGRIDELDKKVDRIDGRVDDVYTAVDGLAKRHLDFNEALAMERSARERLEERVDVLER